MGLGVLSMSVQFGGVHTQLDQQSVTTEELFLALCTLLPPPRVKLPKRGCSGEPSSRHALASSVAMAPSLVILVLQGGGGGVRWILGHGVPGLPYVCHSGVLQQLAPTSYQGPVPAGHR